jgi:ligand-binding SRPBCC domain-containing protein
MTHRLECTMTVAAPLADVFRFFEDPRNLERITPPWLNFKILHPDSLVMRKGELIDYVIRWMGIPLNWRTRIADYTPPLMFIDEQIHGPYVLWHHTHTFEETADGVLIKDQVDYRLPLGPLGDMAHAVMVKAQLLGIFRYRQTAIAKIFGVKSSFGPVTTSPLADATLSASSHKPNN